MLFSNKGLLGINARNLKYIKGSNNLEATKFADSKLKTKHYLSARGIPVPRLYAVIRSHDELFKFDFGSLPGNVVLKPNRGKGGEGIIAFKERKGDEFITVNNKMIKVDDIKAHINDILDGRFSLNHTLDMAFFEQRIQTHEQLKKYCTEGLPDIRVIVYNMIPVMAMLRIPTKDSEGRANLAQGAIGIGLDLASGKHTYIVKKYKILKKIPGFGKIDPDFRVPFFKKILLIASRCQMITNLGYLACDFAIDENSGPILLEINARAGLKVQIANKAPLRKRLEQIEDTTVNTPEKGVRVAADLWGIRESISPDHDKSEKIISLTEVVELLVGKRRIVVKAKIDPCRQQSVIGKQFKDVLSVDDKDKESKVKFNLKGKRIQTIAKIGTTPQNYGLIIGKRDLSGFLIDVKESSIEEKESKLPRDKKKDTRHQFYFIPQIDFGQIDFQIHEVSRDIKLLKRLTPLNLQEEIEKFKKDTSYNPRFRYEIPGESFIKLHNSLENIKCDDSDLGHIFMAKKNELIDFVNLIGAIGSDGFTSIADKIYKRPTAEELKSAKEHRKNYKYYQSKYGKKLSARKTAKIFEETLKKYKLAGRKVYVKSNMVSDISVNKNGAIFLKHGAKFSEFRIKKLIAHEIETHVLTAENGKKQPYRIFQDGFANYLETQEGLAIYNQEVALQIYPNSYFAAGNTIAVDTILDSSFAEGYAKLLELGFHKGKALTLCLKSKRGLEDTSKKGGFPKQAIYFRGAKKIDRYVKEGGKLEELYIGKINIDFMSRIRRLESINPPIKLPEWY